MNNLFLPLKTRFWNGYCFLDVNGMPDKAVRAFVGLTEAPFGFRKMKSVHIRIED